MFIYRWNDTEYFDIDTLYKDYQKKYGEHFKYVIEVPIGDTYNFTMFLVDKSNTTNDEVEKLFHDNKERTIFKMFYSRKALVEYMKKEHSCCIIQIKND